MGEGIVRDAYDERPFPPRNPDDEAKRLIKSDYGNFRIINGVFWGGRKAMNGFRALDAGCGTGDAVIYLATELQGTDAEIVALDISERTLDIVRKRAEKRGLKNIRYVHASIADLGKLGLGRFDYIICTSVLPHLDDPEGGMRLLSDSLKEDGGMLLQVYAKYGKFPINLVQEICRIVNKGEPDIRKKHGNALRIIEALPKEHPFRKIEGYSEDPYDFTVEDHTRQFSVRELYEFVEGANLDVARFKDFPLYSPAHYGCTLEAVRALPKKEQEAVAELLNGRIMRHILYAIRKGKALPEPSPDDERLVPEYKFEGQEIPDLKEGEAAMFRTKEYLEPVKIGPDGCLIMRLVDGKRSVGEILDEAAMRSKRAREDVKRDWLGIFGATSGSDFIILKLP
jgi:2-polyprenyl-3-methyl-5-hydroxy-6-metoxy-1,4-benzoquinol methylase